MGRRDTPHLQSAESRSFVFCFIFLSAARVVAPVETPLFLHDSARVFTTLRDNCNRFQSFVLLDTTTLSMHLF
jgi:hypothetical protein